MENKINKNLLISVAKGNGSIKVLWGALILVLFSLGLAKSSWAADFYIAQNQAGTNDGSTCANARAVDWFNTTTNWANPKQTGKIGPEDTVHLCGTFTASSANTTMFTVRGGGSASAGYITIKFEDDAVLQSPQWGTDGAILIHSYYGATGYIIIDGGKNGIIRNTANGTGLTNHAASTGIAVFGWYNVPVSHFEITNLTIKDIYKNLGNVYTTLDTDGQPTTDISVGGNLDNFSIHDNKVYAARTGINISYEGSHHDNADIYNNYIADHDWGIVYGAGSQSTEASANNVKIHDNEITDFDNWQCPSQSHFCCPPDADCTAVHGANYNDLYHTDGIFLEQVMSATNVFSPLIYNNNFHGNLGRANVTAFIFCTSETWTLPPAGHGATNCNIFNNLFLMSGASSPAIWMAAASYHSTIFNNTVIGDPTNIGGVPFVLNGIGDTFKNNLVTK